MTRAKVIRRLVSVQPEVFKARPLKPTRCILATAVGIDVLAAFGIDARPLSVRLDLVNGAWVQWVRDGKPGGAEGGQAAGAWWLSAGYPDRRNILNRPLATGDWDGHLMIEVPSMQLLIDLDSQQLNRPAKNITMPDAVVLHVPANWGTVEFDAPGGGKLLIEPRRDDLTFREGRDWSDRARRDELAHEVIRKIRKGKK